MNLLTIGDIARTSLDSLTQRLGENGRRLWLLANLCDHRPVEPLREAKSIGSEETFECDLRESEAVKRKFLALAVKVGERLREKGLKALTVSIKARDNRFKTLTRSKSLINPTWDHQSLYAVSLELMPFDRPGPWRLLGLTCSNLVCADNLNKSASLFDNIESHQEKESHQKLLEAIDKVNRRFGGNSLKPATLLDSLGPEGQRGGEERALGGPEKRDKDKEKKPEIKDLFLFSLKE
ncbi:MAG: hypothetical protein LBV23_05335, partial [Deltaproteobacteria bacterium]|jgi:DNA polymerase-4|nr:hypothetical protein [Deltaproteobacteria bacterium]